MSTTVKWCSYQLIACVFCKSTDKTVVCRQPVGNQIIEKLEALSNTDAIKFFVGFAHQTGLGECHVLMV